MPRSQTKKVTVLLALLATACAVYVFLIRRPGRQPCSRISELCGLDDDSAERCTHMVDSLKTSNAPALAQLESCVAEAKSCGGAVGCASGAALSTGIGFVRDFLTGLRTTAK